MPINSADTRVFPTGGMRGESPHYQKFAQSLPYLEKSPPVDSLPTKFLFPLPKFNFPHQITMFTNKNFIFRCCHCSCTSFILTSCSLYTQAMLILTLINVQYLQNVVFSFEKCLNGQKHSASGSHHSIKQFPWQNFHWGDFPLNTIWKTLGTAFVFHLGK